MKQLNPSLSFWDNPKTALWCAAISGLISVWAFTTFNKWLALVALVPLFLSMHAATKLRRVGFVFGLAYFGSGYYWMPTSWPRFTGLPFLTGLLPYLLATLIMTATVVGLFWVFEKMRQSAEHKHAAWLNALLLASLWTLMEAGRMHLFASFPFFASHQGFALAADVYALQPVSVFGFSILTFVVVFANACFAQAVLTPALPKLALPVLFLVAYWGLGYGLFQYFEKPKTAASSEIKATLICTNQDAEFKWNEANGNTLVKTMLGQYQNALKTNPDLVIWTETAVPWKYAPDDDFLLELKRLTEGKNTRNVFGISTATESDNQFYNSAYLLEPDGSVAARYDKRLPLALLEAPFFGHALPFPMLGGMTGKPGTRAQTLPTPKGKVGMMICNESVVPSSAASMALEGADFLVNMSNDAWFSKTYIALQHFYNARVRAVETRRDVVVNSNQGYCGHIAASGKITAMEQHDNPRPINISIYPNAFQTMASQYPYWFLVLLFIFSTFFLKFKFFSS